MVEANRDRPVTFYVSEEERLEIEQKAKKMGLSTSSYVRVKALEGD